MNFFKRDPENISIEDNWQFFKSQLLSILDSRIPRKISVHGMIPHGLLGTSRNYGKKGRGFITSIRNQGKLVIS